jgi:hypothetical protein
MYTGVSVRLMDNEKFTLEGHGYDVSEGGIQFELDRGIEPGTPVAMQIALPQSFWGTDEGPGRAVFVFGNVVWADDSEPGPVRMAVVFTRFARAGDRERLLEPIQRARIAEAA